jgi:hypothetical protein
MCRAQTGGNSRTHRRLEPPVAVLAALAFALFAAQAVKAQDVGAQGGPAASTEALHIKGDAKAIELEIHQATLAQVLTALGRFDIRCRSRVALNDVIDGTYAGSLGHVLSRVLVGYNYAIEQSDAKVEVIVVGRYGEQATPGPIIVRRRRSSE